MNWDRVRHEENTKRYGKEDVAGKDAPPPMHPFSARRGKRRPEAKAMTPGEKRRWEEAVRVVYKKEA